MVCSFGNSAQGFDGKFLIMLLSFSHPAPAVSKSRVLTHKMICCFMFFCFLSLYMFSAFRIFLLRCASVAVCEAHQIVGWSVGCYFHSLAFLMILQSYKRFLRIRKYLSCFFVSFASFFANLAVRSPQGTQKLRKARKFV